MRMPKLTIRRLMIAVAALAFLAGGLKAMSVRPDITAVDGGVVSVLWSDGSLTDSAGPFPAKFHEYRLITVVEWSDGSYRVHPHLP